MKQLLNKNARRQLNLLECLYRKDSWVAIHKMAAELECTEKTLRHDISYINEVFQPFEIETSKRKGLRLVYPPNYSFDFIFRTVLASSLEFQMLECIFLNEQYSVDDLAELLFVSPSTLRRLITKVNQRLSGMDIQITINPCRMIGNEAHIRILLIQFFSKKHLYGDYPFSSEEQEFVRQLLAEFTAENEIDSSFFHQKFLEITILLCLIRMRNGHVRPVDESFPTDISTAFLDNSEMASACSQLFGISLNKSELQQLFFMFLRPEAARSEKHLMELVRRKQCNAHHRVYQIERFLDRLSERIGIPMPNKYTLLLKLYNVQTLFDYDKKYDLEADSEFFYEHAVKTFPHFIEVVKEVLKEEPFSPALILEGHCLEMTVQALMMYWTGLTDALGKHTEPLCAGLILDWNEAHATLIKDLLSFQFRNLVSIHVIRDNDWRGALGLKSYQLVITNLSELPWDDCPVICINSIPSATDWHHLKEAIEEIMHHRLLLRPFI